MPHPVVLEGLGKYTWDDTSLCCVPIVNVLHDDIHASTRKKKQVLIYFS